MKDDFCRVRYCPRCIKDEQHFVSSKKNCPRCGIIFVSHIPGETYSLALSKGIIFCWHVNLNKCSIFYMEDTLKFLSIMQDKKISIDFIPFDTPLDVLVNKANKCKVLI